MFTGIAKELGKIQKITRVGELYKLTVASKDIFEKSDIGDSVAVNGICLTVANKGKGLLYFDAVAETIKRSNLGMLKEHDTVNLEGSLRAGEAIGGHFVLGHIDCVGVISDIEKRQEGVSMRISVPEEFRALIVRKGSIAVEGISLTASDVARNAFKIHLVPHTLKATALGLKKAGDVVNIEFDIIGKYIARLKEFEGRNGITETFLKDKGFL